MGYPLYSVRQLFCFAIAWSWIRVRFCPDCGRQVTNFSGKKDRWCSECGRLIQTEAFRVENQRLELSAEIVAAEIDRTSKCMQSLLLLGVYDRIDVMVFEPSVKGYRLYAILDGEEIDLEPPPYEIHRQIVALTESMFDIFLYQRFLHQRNSSSQAIEGTTDRGSASVIANIQPTQAGDLLRFSFEHLPLPDSSRSPRIPA